MYLFLFASELRGPQPLPRLTRPSIPSPPVLCSALPETLDPASYASLLPCRGGDIDRLFAGASATAGGQDFRTAAAAAEVERQQDPRVIAAWYAGRARELDARAGQLRHAATMCQLGASRVRQAEGGSGAGAGEGADAAMEELFRLDLLLQHLVSLVSWRACLFAGCVFVYRGSGCSAVSGVLVG